MLELDTDQYLQAAAAMARALDKAESGGFRTFAGRVCAILDALGEEFDVSPMDPGRTPQGGYDLTDDELAEVMRVSFGDERDDIASGEVWACAHCDGDHSTEDHRRLLNERLLNEMGGV